MSTVKDTWKKPPFIANPVMRYGLYAAVAIYFVVTLATLPIDWDRVADGMSRAQRIFSGAFPPSFDRAGLLFDGFMESLKIAILATVGGIAVSVPLAFMAAGNIAVKPVYLLGRGIIIVARSFHPVIVAIIFVKAVGFGPFAGALTLVVYSIGFVAKLLAERIEEIDFGQVEAMRSAGAGFIATLAY
ncbi:MAG: ABC transporter permease subunit, partial [Pseudomonadota bacterium]|nr:ABC transporter permease subunit [Pseudomonadota bacterium]